MKRKRHTEEQIIAILKEHEAGVKTADLCRKHGISEASFYNWKVPSTAGSEAKRLLVPHRATMVTATAACPPAQARTVRE